MNLYKPGVLERGHASVRTAVQGNTQFALALYHRLQSTPGNLFFSPYSISTALAMTWAGARGYTEIQIAQALHFQQDQKQLHPAFAVLEAALSEVEKKGQVQLRVANSLWPQQGYALLEEFLVLAQHFYDVQITPVDYRNAEAARQEINTWVEEKTQERIKDLIPSGLLDALTRLVLVNAIYFKGSWHSQFDQSLTQNAPFWITQTEQVPAMLMTQKRDFRYAESAGLQVLELPYAGEDLSMLILLPGEISGLAQLEKSLTLENLESWTKNLQEKEVSVFLPRFEITFPFRLDDALQSMGMVDAFSSKADFSGIDGTKELFIGAVLHQAFVIVNEEGTEAAAATAVVMARLMASPVPVFRADHPFIFLIRENSTGSILFLGRVLDPSPR